MTPLIFQNVSREDRRVVILRDDHIGDLVLTTSLMQALHEDGWAVDLVGSSAGDLLQGSSFVRNVEMLRTICPTWPHDWRILSDWMKAKRYTASIVPFCRPVQLLWASTGSGTRHRIAMGTTFKSRLLAAWNRHQFFPTNFLNNPRPYYEIMVDCATPLVAKPVVKRPHVQLSAGELKQGQARLSAQLDGPHIIGIHPTCFGNTCNLPLQTYKDLIDVILEETSWSVVVTGGPGDQALLESWKELELEYPRRFWLSAGELDLRELGGTLAAMTAFVSTGTGPMHLAQAVGTRTVSPFCPQRPICPTIWGYAPFDETAVEPNQPPCDPNRPHGENCDFKGSLTSRDLMDRLRKVLDSSSLSS